MGQSTSLLEGQAGGVRRSFGLTNELVFEEMDFIHDQIRKHSLTLRQLTLLTNDEFHEKIAELNALSSKYVDCNSKQLLFEVKPGTDRSVLWKGTVRIKCVKIDANTQKIEKSRELSLKQFLQVYNTLQLHLSAVEKQIPSQSESDCCSSSDEACCAAAEHKLSKIAMNSSVLLDGIGGKEVEVPGSTTGDLMGTAIDEESCCICMDSKPQVSLPCAHSYCLACIEQWNVDHKTCPICRETLENTDDTWVLEDVPNSQDVSQEIQKSLFELTK